MGKGAGEWRAAGTLTSIALLLAVATLLGGGVGYYLDSRWHTTPWLTLVGVLIGLAGGFVEMFEILKRYEERERSDRHGPDRR